MLFCSFHHFPDTGRNLDEESLQKEFTNLIEGPDETMVQ